MKVTVSDDIYFNYNKTVHGFCNLPPSLTVTIKGDEESFMYLEVGHDMLPTLVSMKQVVSDFEEDVKMSLEEFIEINPINE